MKLIISVVYLHAVKFPQIIISISLGGDIKTERAVLGLLQYSLNLANATSFQLDISSTKRLFSSLSNNILELRDGGSISKNQAMEFFNQAFDVS